MLLVDFMMTPKVIQAHFSLRMEMHLNLISLFIMTINLENIKLLAQELKIIYLSNY